VLPSPVLRQHYASSNAKPSMPSLLFKDCITSLLELTTKYKVGIMLTSIVTVSLQDNGKILLEEVSGSNALLNDMREVFQMMLAYWA
jgi:hypothetical protein